MPKIIDFEARRREIMLKAVPIFASEGYRGAHFAKIAEVCGFGRTAIYPYFKDKEELFRYTIDAVFTTIEDAGRQVRQTSKGRAVERIEQIMRRVCETTLAEAQPLSIVLDLWLRIAKEQSVFADQVRGRVHRLIAWIEAVLEEGELLGELVPMDRHSMAVALFSLLEAFAIHASLLAAPDIEGNLASLRLLLKGLEKSECPDS